MANIPKCPPPKIYSDDCLTIAKMRGVPVVVIDQSHPRIAVMREQIAIFVRFKMNNLVTRGRV